MFIFSQDAVMYVASGVVSLVIIGTSIWAAVRPIVKSISKINHDLEMFMRDWKGSSEEPGRDAVPGVMERLNRLDGELSKNGGKSVKDTVNRIEKRLIEGDKKFTNLELRTKVLEDRLSA
jgi:hypothetical protein